MKDIKSASKVNLEDAIQKKIDSVIKMLDVDTLDPDDLNLSEQITLGDKWDDPFELTKAMDRQPMYYARWATLLRRLKRDRQKITSEFDVWLSITRDRVQKKLFDENIESGMTANNAKPTQPTIESRFNKLYVDPKSLKPQLHQEYMKYKKPVDEIEYKVDVVEVIVKAFEQRKDMMISLGSLVRGMIDNQLLIYKNKKKTVQ